MRRLAILALLLPLAACGSSDSGPGGVTANEAKALDDAAEMVESRNLPEGLAQPAPAASAPAAAKDAPSAK